MATTKKTTTKSTATKKASAPRKTAAEKLYDKAYTEAETLAEGKTAYLIGDEPPYLYMAISDGGLNLVLYQWREVNNPKTGDTIEKWAPMGKYASNVSGAMLTFLNEAQREHPRAQKTADLAAQTEEICKKLDRIKNSLSKIAATRQAEIEG